MKRRNTYQRENTGLSFETRNVIVRGSETVATIFSPMECDDFKWIEGHKITLNGRPFKVRKVTRTSTLPVCRKGEDISLIGTTI